MESKTQTAKTTAATLATQYIVVVNTPQGWTKAHSVGFEHFEDAKQVARTLRGDVRISTCPPRNLGHGFTGLNESDFAD